MTGGNGSDGKADILIKTEDLWKTYQMGAEEIHALRGVSFEIQRGEYVAIMGPSGSGKSTMMNLIGCLDTPSKGKYFLNSRLVSDMNDDELAHIRNKEIGFVFQTFNLLRARDGAAQRRAAADLQRHALRTNGRSAPSRRCRPSNSANACTTSRTSSRAASGSASRSRGPW